MLNSVSSGLLQFRNKGLTTGKRPEAAQGRGSMQSFQRWATSRQTSAKIVCGLISIVAMGAIGIVDYIADYRVSFTVLYVLPIGFATLYVNRFFAVCVAILSVATWNSGDFISDAPFPGMAIESWNDGIVFSLYAIVIYLVYALRRAIANLEVKVEDRTRAMQESQKERERLEHEILGLSERERQAFGHELHDVICQDLAGLAIACNLLAKRLDAKEFAEADDAHELAELVDRTLAKTRSVAGGYFTVGFNVEGLAAALAEIARNAESRSGIRCEIHWENSLVISSEEVVMHFFRIAQEAIMNAIKHSGASKIIVNLSRRTENIELCIEDNGTGLKSAQPSGPGLGLRIMAYRADTIGGRLKVESSPTGGVRIVCLIPIEKIGTRKVQPC